MKFLCALFFVLFAATTVPAQAASRAYTIFERAQAHWLGEKYPRNLNYIVAVSVQDGGKWKTEHYKSAYNAVTGTIHIDPVSDYQDAHPPSGRGINLSLFFFSVSKPTPPIDFLGVPKLAPTYTFGMAPFHPMIGRFQKSSAEVLAEIRKEYHDPFARPTPQPAATPLRIIAISTTTPRDYRITLRGVESLDGHTCYHLSLEPLHDPGRLRLRELWIDSTTYATIALREASNFITGPGTSVAWTVTFSHVGAARYIKDERAEDSIAYGGLIYTKAFVRFQNITAQRKAVHKNRFPMFVPLFLQEPPARIIPSP